MPNRWWPVALSEDVTDMAPTAVVCGGQEVVLFRSRDGVARALLDQCAHRRVPLSLGHIKPGGLIECPYHGWRYEGLTGRCVEIPNLAGHEPVPKAYRVPAFATAERDGFVYLSLAEQAGEAPALAPLAQGDEAWRGSGLIAYPWEALVDLLLDAPGAVLSIPGVTILDTHRYGDPTRVSGQVIVEHAAGWSRQLSRARKVIADYPLTLRLAVDLNGAAAQAELRTDAGETLADLRLGLFPVKATLAGFCWRGAGAARKGKLLEIKPRGHIAAEAVRAAVAYPSTLRRDAVRAQTAAPVAA